MYLLVLPMTLLGSLGALFFKKSASDSVGLVSLLRNYRLYVGGACYVGGALLNILLLRCLEYSVVYPMTAITYIWTLFLSHRLLGERVTGRKLAGVLAICLGVFILAQ